MKSRTKVFATVVSGLIFLPASFFVACGTHIVPESEVAAKNLSVEEKLIDFDVAVNNFKSFYAPLKFKEKSQGLRFDELSANLRSQVAASSNDAEFYDILGKLAASFNDGHVSVRIPAQSRWSLPFITDFLDGKYIVVQIDPDFSSQTGVAVGDELLALDGIPAKSLAQELAQFHKLGYERANARYEALVLTKRSFNPPKKKQTFLDFARAKDGATFNIMTFWNETAGAIPAAEKSAAGGFVSEMTPVQEFGKAGVAQFGQPEPFFITPQSQGAFNFTRVSVSPQAWAAAGQTGTPENVFAALYRYKGQGVLLIRIPSYSVSEEKLKSFVMTYKLTLESFAPLADVLVIDQTHNPGGSVEYVEELASLFLKQPGPSFAFAPRADRRWLKDLQDIVSVPGLPAVAKSFFAGALEVVNDANERGDFLAPPVALTRITTTIVDKTAWKKPVLLLIDELCGSGGDGFPLIMKGNKAATLFGHRTAGMGGNVDLVPELPNSGAAFRLTRSLFYLARPDGSLPESAIVENNGVAPDLARDYGLVDYREGFTKYVTDFSEAAIGLVQQQ